MKLIDGRLRIAAGDVANFLACRHLTRLDLAVAHQLVAAPMADDLGAKALEERGIEHEKQVLDSVRARGWTVEDHRTSERDRTRQAEATFAAMRRGVDVIYQGTLLVDDRLGLPDFLVRADLVGRTCGHQVCYEVIDAKLARSAKARAVLQTAFYSDLLGEVQGHIPEFMHLALGSQELLALRVADYAAYARQVIRLLRTFAADDAQFPPSDTYPEPVEHCALCRWRAPCQQRRRDDDDLSLIAGITARQRKALKISGISTRRGFATLEKIPDLDGVNPQTMTKVHAQAKLQVAGDDAGCTLWEFVDPERDEDGALVPNRGLSALPPPSPGDLFFDIEGARYYCEDGKEYGLQYLFGIVDTADCDGDGKPRYHAFWSFDRAGEKRAFEQLVDQLGRVQAHQRLQLRNHLQLRVFRGGRQCHNRIDEAPFLLSMPAARAARFGCTLHPWRFRSCGTRGLVKSRLMILSVS